MTEQATDPKMEEEMTDENAELTTLEKEILKPLAYLATNLRRVMTEAGIAHDHVDDKQLSRAIREASAGAVLIDNGLGNGMSILWYCYA